MKASDQTRDIESYAQEYMNAEFEETMVQIRKRKLLAVTEPFRHQRVLEIGCGMDSIGNSLRGCEELTIVEPSSRFLHKAREDSAAWQNVVLHFVHGFFEEQTEVLSRNSYDLILISSLLHEVCDSDRFLLSVRSLCDTSTTVHVNVPNALSFHRLLGLESGLISSLETLSPRNARLQQRNVYTLKTLKALLGAAGDIQVCDEGSYFIKPLTHEQMQFCFQHQLFDPRVLKGLEGMVRYMPEYGAEIYVNFRFKNVPVRN